MSIRVSDPDPLDHAERVATNPSCGFASVMAAVANANPDWIATHVTYSPNAAGANNAKVSLYDKSAPKEFSITCAETAQKSDVDASTGIW